MKIKNRPRYEKNQLGQAQLVLCILTSTG